MKDPLKIKSKDPMNGDIVDGTKNLLKGAFALAITLPVLGAVSKFIGDIK